LIAPSVAFAEETLRHYGVMPARLRNGRRLDGRRLQPAEKRPFVLTAGRLWDEGKNFGALDAAARLMRGPVLAAGPLQGPGGERVHAGAIQVLGPLGSQALTERLNAAAVFASLALYEPFGLTVLEAAQAGCALVLSDIPTFRELWGGVATFVNPSDPDEVAARLEGLLADPAETLRLGRLAAERSKRFSAEAMTAATLERYAALLGRPNTEAAA
jgi:glycosyltransferase involved in cell wall biosynthesis